MHMRVHFKECYRAHDMKIPRRIVYYELIVLVCISVGILMYYSINARRKNGLVLWTESIKRIDDAELHDKWIIVTSVSMPSTDVHKLAAIDGWKLLVVGDLKTPTNWRHPGVVFLGVEKQRTLPYRTIEKIPYDSYTRKNIGYLYAIHHGARYIYDTDDDNHPTSGRIEFQLKPTTTGLIYQDTDYNVTNPYAHFGQPTIWPRGYPLEAINAPINNTYTLCTFKTPAIQQGLVNKDPDVDAIFRMTREKQPGLPFNITFDARAPPFALPDGVFAPFNSQNTLFAYEALWALLLPTSVKFRATDIWRGYWAQRLLWLLGHKLAFCPPNAIQVRNHHDYLKDFKDESDVYAKSGRLISYLKSWNCSQNKSFFQCASQLSEDMVAADFWQEDEADLIVSWLSDLKSIGYVEPTMDMVSSTNDDVGCDLAAGGIRTVYFSPVMKTFELQMDVDQKGISCESNSGSLSRLQKFCHYFLNERNNSEAISGSKFATNVTNENILLIIVFNKPFHSVIPLLENLYRHQFPNMAYCGEVVSYEDVLAKAKSNSKVIWPQRPITFISIKSEDGFFSYECTIRAIEMNYAVEGYLVLGDDVLFNFWNFHNVDLSKAAYTPGAYHHTRYKRANESGWNWWKTDMGYNASNLALHELNALLLQESSEEQRQQSSGRLEEYFDNRYSKAMNDTISINLSDVYYLPKSKQEMFIQVTKVFYKHRVFLEIAVPTAIDGLYPTAIPSLTGKSIWGGDRSRWNVFFNDREMFLHPVKLSETFSSNDARKMYCEHYVQKFLSSNNDY